MWVMIFMKKTSYIFSYAFFVVVFVVCLFVFVFSTATRISCTSNQHKRRTMSGLRLLSKLSKMSRYVSLYRVLIVSACFAPSSIVVPRLSSLTRATQQVRDN